MGEFFKMVSIYKVGGLIPLDLLLHFLVGMIITIVSLKKNLSFGKTIALLVVIAGGKEVVDFSLAHPASPFEYLSDFLMTLLFAVVLWGARLAKRKHASLGKIEKWKIYK